MRRTAVVVATFAGASVLLTGTPASADTLQPSGWQYAKSAPTNTVGSGDALSCVTQNWCMSVGTAGTQVWDGQQWSSAGASQLKFDINALSCFSKWDCMVVGSVSAEAGTVENGAYEQPVAMHWNGTSWVGLHPPVQLPSEDVFRGVSCPAVKTCVITGDLVDRVLLWQNGTWSSQPIALPDGGMSITVGDIDCPAPTSCHALSVVRFPSTPAYAYGSTAMSSWDGTSWTTELVPDDSRGSVGLSSISCPATTWCMATGADAEAIIGDAWDGTTWQAKPVPDSPDKAAEQEPDGYQVITAVSCWTVDRCQAVGITNTAPFHRYWNGTVWSSLANPTVTDVVAAAGVRTSENDIDCLYYSFCLTTGDRMERFLP